MDERGFSRSKLGWILLFRERLLFIVIYLIFTIDCLLLLFYYLAQPCITNFD